MPSTRFCTARGSDTRISRSRHPPVALPLWNLGDVREISRISNSLCATNVASEIGAGAPVIAGWEATTSMNKNSDAEPKKQDDARAATLDRVAPVPLKPRLRQKPMAKKPKKKKLARRTVSRRRRGRRHAALFPLSPWKTPYASPQRFVPRTAAIRWNRSSSLKLAALPI